MPCSRWNSKLSLFPAIARIAATVVRVVRGELRIDAAGHAEQLSGAGNIGDVGVRFTRETG